VSLIGAASLKIIKNIIFWKKFSKESCTRKTWQLPDILPIIRDRSQARKAISTNRNLLIKENLAYREKPVDATENSTDFVFRSQIIILLSIPTPWQ